MKPIKLLVLCVLLLLVAFFSGVSAATDPLSKANRLPASLEKKVQDFQHALEANGYEVVRGYWDLWTAEDCKYSLQTVGFCYGNNPTAPYAMAFVPAWKDEFVDKSMKHVLTQEQKGMNPNYRLGEQEAIVVLAEIPPPARYFGYQTFVSTREALLNTDDDVYKILNENELDDLKQIVFGFSPNPDRMMMLASIGDTINNVVIEEQSDEVWAQQRFFVTTPNKKMAEAMIDAFESVDVPAKNVFTEPVSPYLLNIGYGPEADDFFTVIRYSMPNDKVLGEQWREQLPLTILRVRYPDDKDGEMPFSPFDIPEYEAKKANYDENALQNDLSNLVKAVKEYWGQKNAETANFNNLSIFVDLVGQHCLGHDGPPTFAYNITLPRGPMNCLGDSQDADYQISGGTYHLDDGQVIAVVGTLGTETGNATYTSLSVNWFPILYGVLNSDDPVLKGSAVKFKYAVSDYKKFYVYYYARDCSGLYPYCQEISRKLVPRGGTIKIAQRNYVNPDSRRAPDPWKMLNPVAIEFDGSLGKRPKM